MTTTRFALRTMRPRDPAQPHRASSPLEAFFDLVFVVAVSLASGQLHHHETAGDLLGGVLAYLMVFFAIWWAWMNFTWFATSFDVDDWLYRLMTIVQMGGALVMAAGAPSAMNDGDFRLLVVGYLIMRLALVPQWLRAAAQSADYRRTALSYAVGIVVVQTLWVAWLWLPGEVRPWVFLPLVVLELLVPVVAERRQRRTPWHPEHIAERYGLFTLIVLGESVLASTNAVVDAVDHVEHLGTLVGIAACGLVLAAGMWWTYYAREHTEHFSGFRQAITFGYGHYLVFAAAGAFSAGIEVEIDAAAGEGTLPGVVAGATLTVPVAVFVLGTWFLTLRGRLSRPASVCVVVLAIGIALAAWLPATLPTAAVLMAGIVVTLEVSRRSDRTVEV